MWLDRLAGGPSSASSQSTPQPANRSYSPLPRRTSSSLSPYLTSQRADHSPRSSSLSLVSNDSSTSLLPASRRPNGSSLRHSSTIPDLADPLETLERLLKEPSHVENDAETQKAKTSSIVEADLDLDFDFGGLGLKELASAHTLENGMTGSWQPQTMDGYHQERAKFEDLHRSITACDDVLNSVQVNLADFRNDLAAVSADIESLQERSTALNRRLENRREVEKALGPLVEELSLPPEVISKISTGHIDESWAKMLSELDRRTTSHKAKTSSASQLSKASEELGPLLERLTSKAIERIRDFLVAQIKALRSPHINAQIIQQQNFLRFRDLFTFLHKHHVTLADQVSQAYMNTMRWYYHNQFSRYERALAKIKTHTLDKTDTLGHEDTTRMTTVLSSARSAGPLHDAFNLGRRIDLLKTTNQAAMSSYLAEEDQATHYLEVQFRNYNLALIDNATAEYSFLATFFSPAFSHPQISKIFDYIFEPTLEVGRALSRTLVADTFDALGIFLCIRLNQRFAFELQRRKVPVVDGYINGTNMLLWPRLQVVMDRHCESVRQLTNSLPSKPTRSASDVAKMTAAPHVVTQRFGQLLHGFLELSSEAGDDEPVFASLRRLRTEIEAFLAKQSLSYGSDRRKSNRFLYNNYSLIMTIISDASGKLATEQQAHFEKLKLAYEVDV
ncbi:Vps52 / Sac2 family protein [Metarhizium album ARSEF 1941]|uniref:Vps52 / Sac2 family protein n=1 Tax=Metarhizium album (strain ARSEF 1941) TaxID=1081103 RepID=A0A0B2WW97_METAS|nr:Vps52 / Sac2 family protein [Metarhizium album ARSEF 1941]KHN97879.1 Vps52 / Sac2 family protein [Metarhizium album ARSEF 1941]